MNKKKYSILIQSGDHKGVKTTAEKFCKTDYYVTSIVRYNSKKNKYYYKIHRSNFKIL